MSCEYCTDPDGAACFPMYGIGPHKHIRAFAGTVILHGPAIPGYTPNPDEPGFGVHWCPHCGDGKPDTQPAEIGRARDGGET